MYVGMCAYVCGLRVYMSVFFCFLVCFCSGGGGGSGDHSGGFVFSLIC